MKPSAQRVAIAEACGWWVEEYKSDFSTPKTRWVSPSGERQSIGSSDGIPDYLDDLNACHEMEKVLSKDDWDEKFYYWLGFVVSGGQTTGLWEWRKMSVHATAPQRCEAFLRTIEKWQE